MRSGKIIWKEGLCGVEGWDMEGSVMRSRKLGKNDEKKDVMNGRTPRPGCL